MKKTKIKKILISAANGTIMPELITHLKKYFYVIGIDSNEIGLAKKYCDEFYKSPPGKDIKFIKFLEKIGKKVDMIFLFVDEELDVVSKNIHKLNKIKNKIILSPLETINICNNKLQFEKFFGKFKNIKLPTFKKNKKNIIKPKIGRGSKNIFISGNQKIINNFHVDKNFIVQEYIKGTEYTVDCLFDKNGELIFSLPRERLVAQNVSIVGKIVKNRKINNFIELIGSKLNFYGPVNVQIIINKDQLYLIEINPRLSGSIIFSIKSGFDPIRTLFKIQKNKKHKINDNKIDYNKSFYRFLKSVSI